MARQRREVFGDDYEDALSELREDPEKFAAKPELTQEQRDAVREFIDAGEAFYAAEEAEVAAQGQTEAPPEGQAEEPAYKVGSRIEINGVEYQVVGIDDNDVTLLTKNNITLKWDRALLDKDLGTGDSKVLPEEKTPETPQAQGTETPAIPMKEDGNPDYEATTPQQAHAHIYSDPELSPEEADAYVAANLAEAEKNLKKVQGKAPKMGTDLRKYKEAKAKHQADVEAAQRSVDFWNAVKAEHDRTETERLRTEEQQRKEEKRQETGSNTAAPQIREKWNAAPKVDGMADEIVLPDGTKLKGHYVLTEAGAATPSHNAAEGFTKSEGYPADENGNTVNDRDYERDTDAQRVTRGIAGRYDQRAMQQPVVVSRDGVVLSGNGRTMAGELAARDNTDGAYVSYLAEHADRYGFTPEQVKGMNHPRVVFVPDAEMPYTADTFARFNHVEQKAQSNTENAVKLGKTVPDYVYGRLTDRLANFNTLAELYQDSRAVADTFRDLVDAGIVQENQLPQFFDGGQLSDAGKALIESVLVGKAFEANPEAVRQITAIRSMRQAMATAITEVVRNSRLGNGYDLSAELAAAVDLVYKARQSGMKLGQRVSIHARTGNLFPEEDGATVADYNNAMVMILADVINDNRVTQLKKVLATYNQNAEPFSLGQADIFEGMRSKEDILKDTYNFLNNGNEKQPTEPKRPETRPSGTDEAENPPAAGGSQEGGADEGGVKPEGEADAGEGEAPQPAEEPTTHAATITKQKKAKSKAEEQPKWTVRPENMPEDPAAKKAVELMSAYCQTDEQLFAIDEKLYGIENPNSDEARRLKEEARRLRAHCRQLEAEHETAIDAMNGTQLAAYRKWMIPGDFTDDYYSRNRWEKAKQTAGEVVQGMTPLYKRALQAVRAGDKDALKKQLDKAGKMFSSQTDDVLAAIVENLDHTKKIVKKRGDKEAAELVKKFADRAKSELEKVEQATAAERKQSVDVNKHMPTAEEVAVEEAALEQGLNLIDQHGKPVDQFVVGLAKWANEQGMHIDGTSPETSYEDLYIACEDGFDVMTFVPNSITQGKERNVVIYYPEYNGKALDPHKIYELVAEFNKGRDQKHSAIDWMETYGESAFYDYKTAKEFQAFVEQRMAVEEGKVQESAPTSPKETTPEPPTEASVNEKLEAFVSTKKGKLVQTSTMGVLSKKARYGNGDKTRAQWVAEQVAAGGELCHVADRGKVYPCIQMPGGKTRFKLLKSEYDFAAHIGAKETADKSLSQEAAQRRARMQRISEMIPHRGLELDYEQMINDLSSKLSLNQQEKEQLQLLQEYRMLAEANNEHHGKQYDIRDGNGNATAGTPENSRQTAGGNAPRLQKTNDNATAASAHERQVDVAYMDAVKRGDMETASRLVHEAAQRAGYDNDESWKLNHRAPNSQDGFSVSMDNISEMLPDIYGPKAYLYYGYDAGSHESIDIIRQARDPESMVTVYRSVPKNVKDSRMRNGDWVTPSREYAQLHGKSNIDGPYRIIEEEVPAKNLYNDGNSVVEWGYDDGSNYVYRNTKNNRKLADAVTYDDNGNIIPPSKRFNARKADERYQRGNGSSTYLTPKETALRDVMADAVSNAGIEVNTDAAEGQRVLDEANEQARMEAHKSEAARKRDEALRKQDLSIATVTGKTEKQVRAERRERERKFREETKVLYDRVLSGNFDEVTLQLIDNFINNVTPQNYYGRPLSKRLPQGVGQTLSERERTNSIDALFSRISESAVGADERSGAEAKRRIEEKKKELLKSWAIATGNWHTDVSDFTDDTRPIGSGKDSVVYHGKDGKSVIKVSSGKDEGKRFRPDMDNVALFNYVFLKLADMRHCCSWVDFTRKHGTDALFRITLGDFWT